MQKNNMHQNRVPETPEAEKCDNIKSHSDTISSSIGNNEEYGIQPAKENPSPAYMFQFDARCMEDEHSKLRNPRIPLKHKPDHNPTMLATTLAKETTITRTAKVHFTSDDIYNYSGTLTTILRRIQNYRDYQIAEDFIDALKVSGLSQGRIVYYARFVSID